MFAAGPPRFHAPPSACPHAGMHGHAMQPTDRAAHANTGPADYVSMKQEIETLWTKKLSAALAFIPGAIVSVNVEAGEHGHVAHVVRIEHQPVRDDAAGVAVERCEHIRREPARPLITGVCVSIPDGYLASVPHPSSSIRLERSGEPAEIVRIHEIIATLLPPGGETKIVVTTHPGDAHADTAGAALAASPAAPVNQGLLILAAVAVCALTFIAISGGIQASRNRPAPATTTAASTAATSTRIPHARPPASRAA